MNEKVEWKKSELQEIEIEVGPLPLVVLFFDSGSTNYKTSQVKSSQDKTRQDKRKEKIKNEDDSMG